MADSDPEDTLPEDADDSAARQFERDEFIGKDDLSDELDTDDLEAAYLRALEAMESEEWGVESGLSEELEAVESDADFGSHSFPAPGDPIAEPAISPSANDTSGDFERPSAAGESAVSCDLQQQPQVPGIEDTEIAGADFLSGSLTEVASDPLKVGGADRQSVSDSSDKVTRSLTPQVLSGGSTRITDAAQPAPNATRIIESCLFVGGQPLSAKRLATLLESTGEPSYLEQLIDDLNLEYASQQRPYEIRLGDGGYRMALRKEFEAVRNRVYGVGPRDVKLSQDILEVLALVAYQQPIAHSAVEACGKPNVANILRQLLRRELITLVRIDQSRNGVEYRTSPRFLQVFGLGNLNELPRPEDLAIR